MEDKIKSKSVYDSILAGITWIALILQVIDAKNLGNTFSYFTILSNLLVAVSLSLGLLFPNGKAAKLFSGISVQSAITLYIIIVALIYNFVIRKTWIENFPNLYYNNIFHVLTPILYVIRWIVYIPKGELKWMESLKWLIFPFMYLFYSLIRGNIVNWYPYAFVDLRQISIYELVRNVILVLFLFLLIGCGLVYLDKKIGGRRETKEE